MNAFDPIELVERGYAERGDTLEWMRAVAEPIIACLGFGTAPAAAFCFGPSGLEDGHVVSAAAGHSKTETLADLTAALVCGSPREQRALRAAALVPGLHSSRSVTGSAPYSAIARAAGYVDSPAVVVHPADRPPVVFVTLCREAYRVDSSRRALWRMLATHLGAACRLSGRVRSPQGPDVEYVMASGGRVLHVRGDDLDERTREQLRRAAQDVDRARTRRGRRDPHAALELWRGLFSGRWSLVDHFDSDGKRFLLALRNDPDAPGPALPLRQRQVLFYVATGWSNKEVGYALGISDTTVAAHLSRALIALGIQSRSEWIRISCEVALAAQGAAKPVAAHCRREAS
jgi:DNA-binding CsgD family transcriptional regulator